MATKQTYETRPPECWGKAKEIRQKYYQDYATAHEEGGLRWAGGAWTFGAIPCGLGDDVHSLTSTILVSDVQTDSTPPTVTINVPAAICHPPVVVRSAVATGLERTNACSN